ncbi:hypothetical protein E3V08_01255 [Candidatus Atribacteria bacterium MT.SAG.1]|nr:hypothetical protein E3V08_01255 [Candidatus Atribacteria bacterium MT.SAG.1]
MNFQHKELSQGRWKKLSFFEQMANIGSEVERAINWKNKNNKEYSQLAFERALELIDLTIADEKNLKHLRELTRVRENLADYFVCGNNYSSSEKNWKNYFYSFAFASRLDL